MGINSKYFDTIRIKPDKKEISQKEGLKCAWKGCMETSRYPAPKGRNHKCEYFYFCLKHIREYNQSYNYFSGMNDSEISQYMKQSMTGHRPTWSIESNSKRKKKNIEDRTPKKRIVRNAERKSLLDLGLDIDANAEQIKKRYKALLKRHHPDVNGGNKESENKLRDIIQAYNYLKHAGFC